MMAISPVMHRLLAFGLLLAVIGLIFTIFVWPIYSSYTGFQTMAGQKQEILKRYRAVVSAHEAENTRLRGLLAQTGRDYGYWEGQSEPIISAAMLKAVKQLAQKQHVRIGSAQALPGVEVGGNRYVGVRVIFSGEWPRIRKLIYNLETHTPLLFFKSVGLKTRARVSSRNRSGKIQMELRAEITGPVRRARQVSDARP